MAFEHWARFMTPANPMDDQVGRLLDQQNDDDDYDNDDSSDGESSSVEPKTRTSEKVATPFE